MPLDHYSTLIDANALVSQQPYNSTSKPSDVQVAAVIESVAMRIDATLANIGYVVPIVGGTKTLALLREACTWGTVGLAQQMRATALSATLATSDKPLKNIWLVMFDEWMARLINPNDPFELPDAQRTSAQVEKDAELVANSSVQTIDDSNWLTPTVTRAQVL